MVERVLAKQHPHFVYIENGFIYCSYILCLDLEGL